LPHLDRVIEDDPLCQMWRVMRSNLLVGLGRVDEGITDASKAVELDPGFWVGWLDLGLLLAIRGQHGDARDCAERAMAAAPWSPYSLGLMAATLANTGQAEKGEALLLTLRGDSYGGPVGLAVYALARGDTETAAEWVVKTVEQRFPARRSDCDLRRARDPAPRAAWLAILHMARRAEEHLYQKLQVHSKAEAVAKAIRERLV
jgi:tetratricopeptide (TPR) repeat protein